MYDPNYRLKYRPPKISRLMKYQHLPPPLTDEPPRNWNNWEERCISVYVWMLDRKHGRVRPVPERERRGLWFYAS
jgi:hypothetical protein